MKNSHRMQAQKPRYTPAEVRRVQELRRSGASGLHVVKVNPRRPKHVGRGWAEVEV